MAKDIRERYTVLAENFMIDRETGYAINCGFVLYSAPTDLPMAKSLAEQVKMTGKSYRIVTNDAKPPFKIVDQWLRDGFVPDDGLGVDQTQQE